MTDGEGPAPLGDAMLPSVERIEAIAASLDLRAPNKEALERIAQEIHLHFEVDGKPAPMRGVLDVATGVGKTYVLAAAIEYLAGEGVRNFAVITPGRTILSKTVANFTPGHRKSLLGGMEVEPVVITSENFATAAMREAMDADAEVKLFVFTVQALVRPTSKVARRTHKFQEGLGQAFYERLQQADDLVVFADEHHCYFGPRFSEAVEDLRPMALLGLTATPHRATPADEIIHRYPLAAAIADRLVKTPVIVGRRDDRDDAATKLRDGLTLLEQKERAIERWCAETGAEPVAPLMLVVAPDIDEAEELAAIIRDPSFEGGRYADRVLTVHTRNADEALAQLERLEEPGDPHRVVISVGMLKEGWDNKRVYVIASMRASVSTVLTEQTLGRGLRLPFGAYTDWEMLDTLEVLGHERYEQLLKRAKVLNEGFIDERTRAVLRRNAEGVEVPVVETVSVGVELALPGGGAGDATGVEPGRPAIASIEEQAERGERELERLAQELAPRADAPALRIPLLRMTAVEAPFSLAEITDLEPFERLGKKIAANPEEELRRTRISAEVDVGPDGLRYTRLVTGGAADRVVSPGAQLSLADAHNDLLARLLSAPIVPPRPGERHRATEIVDAFLAGLGTSAEAVLSANMARAAGGLIDLLTREQREHAAKPLYDEVVELRELATVRHSRPTRSKDRTGPFQRGVGYEGYERSLFAEDWFDSSPERAVASLLDDESSGVALWVRLQRGDLPILWAGGAGYHPDFVAVDADGTRWVIEVKSDRDLGSDEVQAKRDAARRWANYVNRDAKVDESWAYLLVSESDVTTAKGSWEALKKLGA